MKDAHKIVLIGGLALGAYFLFRAPAARGVGGVPYYGGNPLVPQPPVYLPPGWLGVGPPSAAAWRAQRAATGRR